MVLFLFCFVLSGVATYSIVKEQIIKQMLFLCENVIPCVQSKLIHHLTNVKQEDELWLSKSIKYWTTVLVIR